MRGAYITRNALSRYVPCRSLRRRLRSDAALARSARDSENDSVLIWRNEPNIRRRYLDVFSPVHTEADRLALLRRFIPTLPPDFQANHTWEVQLNSEGFRGADLAGAKAGAIRIACIGDSWTFGMPVNQDETYPSRLAEWLRQERPDVRYDVENFGVLGYTSFQGLQLMKTRILDLDPDVVVIGFGMNDSNVAGYRDKDMISRDADAATRMKSALKDTAVSLRAISSCLRGPEAQVPPKARR